MENHREEITKKIEDLRAKYKMELNPGKRKILAAQGKALKNAIEMIDKKEGQTKLID